MGVGSGAMLICILLYINLVLGEVTGVANAAVGIEVITGPGPTVVMATVRLGGTSGGGKVDPGVIIGTTVLAKHAQLVTLSAVTVCKSFPRTGSVLV